MRIDNIIFLFYYDIEEDYEPFMTRTGSIIQRDNEMVLDMKASSFIKGEINDEYDCGPFYAGYNTRPDTLPAKANWIIDPDYNFAYSGQYIENGQEYHFYFEID